MPRLEFHQLDRRLERLRVRHPARQRRLMASLAEHGQQTPIVVIETGGRFLVIDGHKRIAALQQLGRDTVEAVVWAMSEADALILERTLRRREPESALEQGWLLAEMEARLGYSIDELARRFDRGRNWVASRLALVETLPEAVQQLVRDGKVAASLAMRYLVPGGAHQPGALPAHGPGVRRTPVDHARSRGVLPGLAKRRRRRAGTPAGGAEVVPQDTAATGHARQRTRPDHRHHATSAGATGVVPAQRCERPTQDRPRRRTAYRTPPANRGARNQSC